MTPLVVDPKLADGFEINVFTRNEHKPPHVHVIKGGWEIRVKIGKRGAVLWDVKFGKPSDRDKSRAVEMVNKHLAASLKTWRKYNGHL